MKRVGDPIEKVFEKVPRRGDRDGDEATEVVPTYAQLLAIEGPDLGIAGEVLGGLARNNNAIEVIRGVAGDIDGDSEDDFVIDGIGYDNSGFGGEIRKNNAIELDMDGEVEAEDAIGRASANDLADQRGGDDVRVEELNEDDALGETSEQQGREPAAAPTPMRIELEALLRKRLETDSFGVFCVSCLKELGLDLDVISVIAPTVHFYSIWAMDLAALKALQSERQVRAEPDAVPSDEIQEEVNSLRILGYLSATTPYDSECVKALEELLLQTFQTPFDRVLYRTALYVWHILIETTFQACLRNFDARSYSRADAILNNVVYNSSFLLVRHKQLLARGDDDLMIPGMLALVMSSVVSLAMSLRDVAHEQLVAQLGGLNFFDSIFSVIYAALAMEIEMRMTAPSFVPHLVLCVALFVRFLGPLNWLYRHTFEISIAREIGDLYLHDLSERGLVFDSDAVRAVAYLYEALLPTMVEANDRRAMEEMMGFFLRVAQAEGDLIPLAKLTLSQLLGEIVRLERQHPEFFFVEAAPGKPVSFTEYLESNEFVNVLALFEKWLVDYADIGNGTFSADVGDVVLSAKMNAQIRMKRQEKEKQRLRASQEREGDNARESSMNNFEKPREGGADGT